MRKKILSALLALMLLLTCLPVQALAVETGRKERLAPQTELVEETTAPTETEETPQPPETQPVEETITAEAVDAGAASGTPDGTPPVLKGITLSSSTVTVPGSVEVIVDVSDDISGVSSCYVYFECEELKETLHCSVSKTYFDENTYEHIEYPDGKWHGTIKVDQYQETGVFVLEDIDVRDVAGNHKYYRKNYTGTSSNYAPLPDFAKDLKIEVTDSENPDSMPPVLKGITLSANTVTAPGSVEVIVDVSDDISGVSSCYVYFECEELKETLHCSVSKTYFDENTYEHIEYPDGKWHGTIEVDQYQETGVFVLEDIDVRDVAGNHKYYRKNYTGTSSNYAPLPDFAKDLKIEVTDSENPDSTPPVLKGITLSANTVTAPGSVEVIVDVSDDISGVSSCYVYFECEELKETLHCSVSKTYFDENTYEHIEYPDGKWHGTIEVDQYQETGVFVLEDIDVRDVAGNHKYYRKNYTGTSSNYAPLPDFAKDLKIKVKNSDADIVTSVSKSDFHETVEAAEDNAYIVADYSGEATLSKEIFESLSGTDKTLDLVSEGITWRFEGSDIVNEVKPIDLHVDIKPVEEDQTGAASGIQQGVAGNPAVVMKFAENGELPGKATIQVKVDYAMKEYLGKDKYLTVYYFNNKTGQLELIAENLAVNGESYVEFPITHCSYYVLTPYAYAGRSSIPMYRMYDPNSSEHFYTGSTEERDTLVAEGWNYEGVGFNFPIAGEPVYRLYEPKTGEHLYTMGQEERQLLLSSGWNDEGVAFNSAKTDEVPQYRLHNPNASRGAYHFTGSTEERDDLIALGWEYQGIGWYSCLQ